MLIIYLVDRKSQGPGTGCESHVQGLELGWDASMGVSFFRGAAKWLVFLLACLQQPPKRGTLKKKTHAHMACHAEPVSPNSSLAGSGIATRGSQKPNL